MGEEVECGGQEGVMSRWAALAAIMATALALTSSASTGQCLGDPRFSIRL